MSTHVLPQGAAAAAVTHNIVPRSAWQRATLSGNICACSMCVALYVAVLENRDGCQADTRPSNDPALLVVFLFVMSSTGAMAPAYGGKGSRPPGQE